MNQLAIVAAAAGMILAAHAGPLYADNVSDCQSGDPDRMIAGCTHLLDEARLKPRYKAYVYSNRGLAFQHKGELDRAIADYGRAIAINPTLERARNNRALLYLLKRRYASAIPDLDAAIALNPKSLSAYMNRGVAYRGLGDYDRALADFATALEIRPSDPLALNNRAYAYSLRGEPEKALADIRAAIALEPDNARFHHSLGEIYFYAGEEDKAMEAWLAVCPLASAEQTQMWQRNLAIRGYYSGDIDGRCDDDLLDAFAACARERCFLHS